MDKEKINTAMNRYTKIMIAFLVLAALSVGPSTKLPGYWWIIPPAVLWLLAMLAALRVEKLKKEAGIRSVSEIVAFSKNSNSSFLNTIFKSDNCIITIAIVLLVCLLMVLLSVGSALVL